MLICIKQHLSSILSSIHEKVKQHLGWIEKKVAYKKCMCLNVFRYLMTIFVLYKQ